MEKNFRTVCFGELMLRLQPNLYTRFLQANTFEATFGKRIGFSCQLWTEFGVCFQISEA